MVMYFRVAHTADENNVPELWLAAEAEASGKPLATLAALNRFLAAWRANDPNGTWGHASLGDNESVMAYADETGLQEHEACAVSDSGEPLFAGGCIAAFERVQMEHFGFGELVER